MLQHTSPVCSTFCIHTWMKLWRHTCEGWMGTQGVIGDGAGTKQHCVVAYWNWFSFPFKYGEVCPWNVPDFGRNTDRLITSGSGLNANLGTIFIWTDHFVRSFSTFKLANTHSSHIPSSKSLTITLLLGAGYTILFITTSPCYSPGICLLSFLVSQHSKR